MTTRIPFRPKPTMSGGEDLVELSRSLDARPRPSEVDRCIAMMASVVEALGAILGPTCEVVLHDLRTPDVSVVAIANGHVTNRKVGSPSSNLVVPILENPYGNHDRFNYRSYTASGQPLKSSSVYFKDTTGRIFAALCMNRELSILEAARKALDEIIQTEEEVDESRFTHVSQLMDAALDSALAGVPIVANMPREDRLRIVADLRSRGIFRIRGAPESAALRLGVSRATIYSDLRELEVASELNQR